jgi:hypothetical protein
MDISFIVGIVIAIIGLIGLVYSIIAFFRLKGLLKNAYGFIALGLSFGYLAILSLVFQDLGILSNTDESLLIKVLLGITAVLIVIGNIKVSKLMDYVPDVLIKAINKYKR